MSSSSAPNHSFLSMMLAGASAGGLGRIPTHPLDTCKARLQVRVRALGSTTSGTLGTGLRHELWRCIRGEGLGGLYSGFGTSFFGSLPAACLYFTSYEACKPWLADAYASAGLPAQPTGPLVSLTAGLFAETLSCVLWVPIDVVKERLQTQAVLYGQDARPYRGNVHAFRTVLKEEGWRGLYKGYGATLLSFGPFSALYFMFYEQLKSAALGYNNVSRPEDLRSSMTWLAACGATAGAAAGFCTNPLDLAKLRLQVQRSTAAAAGTELPFNYRSMADGIVQIVRTEGAAALWKGVVARMAFQAPTTAIGITAFEECRMIYTSLGV